MKLCINSFCAGAGDGAGGTTPPLRASTLLIIEQSSDDKSAAERSEECFILFFPFSLVLRSVLVLGTVEGVSTTSS